MKNSLGIIKYLYLGNEFWLGFESIYCFRFSDSENQCIPKFNSLHCKRMAIKVYICIL